MTRTVCAADTVPERPPIGATRVATVIASHPVLDAYAGYVPPLLAVLQVRCDLNPWQVASVLSVGSITSGLCQPLFAWLTDRVDSRVLGALGLLVAATALSSIGFAHDYATLMLLYVTGMLGVGAYHPVGAASIGQLAGSRRSMGVTLFFVAGMVGAACGPVISTRVTAIDPNGFELLRWTMIPGVVMAGLLHAAIRRVPHRSADHRAMTFDRADGRARWTNTLILTVGNALRYTVYMALVYTYIRWAATLVRETMPEIEGARLATLSSIFCGELTALTMIGMGVGGLLAGMTVRAGREKWPMVLIPLALAPAVALIPMTGRAGSYALAALAGVGFAATIPLAISTAQRLLPHRTSLASSLMMGGAWAVASVGPPLAQMCINRRGVGAAFAMTAVLLAASALVTLLLSSRLLRRVAEQGTT